MDTVHLKYLMQTTGLEFPLWLSLALTNSINLEVVIFLNSYFISFGNLCNLRNEHIFIYIVTFTVIKLFIISKLAFSICSEHFSFHFGITIYSPWPHPCLPLIFLDILSALLFPTKEILNLFNIHYFVFHGFL